MRTIRISDEVWDEIAKRGKFGETEDDVLRREFDLDVQPATEASDRMAARATRPRGHYATNRMHAGVHNHQFAVSFASGENRRWDLPDHTDKSAIRKIRAEAVKFALECGASHPGQTNAVLKALTDAKYYVTK